jgi:hypothetical protein
MQSPIQRFPHPETHPRFVLLEMKRRDRRNRICGCRLPLTSAPLFLTSPLQVIRRRCRYNAIPTTPDGKGRAGRVLLSQYQHWDAVSTFSRQAILVTIYLTHSFGAKIARMMADENIKPLRRAATSGALRSPDPPPSSAVRQRISSRQPGGQNGSPSLSPRPGVERRRSSILSYSSMQSLSDDLINPTTSRTSEQRDDEEVSPWHSTPLAFAILPAIGGIFFKNGTAFVTDVLLLILAAIFMNWSVRLPWDWYYQAQAQLRAAEPEEFLIEDDLEADETAVESVSSPGNSPKQSATEPDQKAESESQPTLTEHNKRRLEAAAELRKQETLGLIATFIFPVMAAYLLHGIRGQLSSSSGALVSDFNLSIFVLAAEIRPFRQLIRLLNSRTLHLQRIVTGNNDAVDSSPGSTRTIKNLEARIAELENILTGPNAVVPNGSVPQRSDVADMIAAEIKKRADPRFEALERAMRRYEKRSTTLSMLTEQRLNIHESKIQDSLSLAAAAAHRTQKRGTLAIVADSTVALMGVPFKLAADLAMWPFHFANLMYATLGARLSGRETAKTGRRNNVTQAGLRDDKMRSVQRRSAR